MYWLEQSKEQNKGEYKKDSYYGKKIGKEQDSRSILYDKEGKKKELAERDMSNNEVDIYGKK